MIIVLLLTVLLLVVSPAWADGPIINQATCSGTWSAPQTNTDGTNLNDLKEYGVYVAPSLPALAALTSPTAIIAAPQLDPPAGATAIWTGCRQLAVGQFYMQVDAVDTSGNRSARSATAPFVLADAVSPQAPGTPTFGP